MNTKVIKIKPGKINKENIMEAAGIITGGGLVVFPTETVYGLGANALDKNAVRKIFDAKGRPSDNPLIIHISSPEHLTGLTPRVCEKCGKLMETFWPGPLTIILKKSKIIPYSVTAGLDTVAVRMPSHPVALALIRHSGVPIAAPSANISGRPSTTSSRHVIEDLFGKVDMIIDGGDSHVGLESTVLDLTSSLPAILRPGKITKEQIEKIIGKTSSGMGIPENESCTPKSPGQKYAHYCPKAKMYIVSGNLKSVTGMIGTLASDYEDKGLKVGIMATEQTKAAYKKGCILSVGSRDKPETIASSLFRTLREFDERGIDIIIAESVQRSGVGVAIMNRMEKAAGYEIIKVEDGFSLK